MPVAWLGLKARALAWLEQAWACDSSGQSPSSRVGLGLAWLGPEPGPPACGPGSGLKIFKPKPWARSSPTFGLAWLGLSGPGLSGLRASGQATGITKSNSGFGYALRQ
ncbi:hypothetical protein FB451DRAFT_1179834 [Mycena latifolia]|nr:hypothetical protein FB451DRAFT_1179834 [Mycena latifolia]